MPDCVAITPSVELQALHIKRERSEYSERACQLQRIVGPSRALTPPCYPTA